MTTAGAGLVRIAALISLAAIEGLWLTQPMPLVLRLGHLLVLGIALWRPTWALIVLASLGPLTTWLATVTASVVPGARHLEGLVLACLIGGVWHWAPKSAVATRSGAPALVFAAVGVVSALAVYPSRFQQVLPDATWWEALSILARDHFLRSPLGDPAFFAWLAAQGAALAWVVERWSRSTPRLAGHLVLALVASHSVAALLNVQRLAEAAFRRDEPFRALGQMWMTTRVSTQYDLNAAGSVFVLVVLAGLGLWGGRRAVVAVGSVLVGAGLWLTGSRVAILAGVAAGCWGLVTAGRRSGRMTTRHLLALATTIGLCAAAGWMWYPSGRNLNVSASVQSRAILFEAGAGMVRDHPWAGAGVGRFHELSELYGAGGISPILEVDRRRENAHNNFLQVAAELGLPGLAAFLWLLAACLAPLWHTSSLTDAAVWRRAGLLAMVMTWLTGHPLLVIEASTMFWLVAGLSAADREPSVSTARHRVSAVALLVLAVSFPWRLEAQRRTADLEHIGRGLSGWHTTQDGQRARSAGERFTLYLPSNTRLVLPLRAISGTGGHQYTVVMEGRVVDQVAITAEDWTLLRFQVPEHGRRFVAVDFERLPAAGVCAPCVEVGRQQIR